MKRPFAAVVSFYVAGLLLAKIFHPPLAALFAVSFLAFLAALAFEKFRPVLLCALLALAGWINLASRADVVSPVDLRSLAGNEPQIATVRGTLTETPNARVFLRDEEQVQRSLARVRINGLRRGDETEFCSAVGTIMATTPGTLPGDFFAGQPVEINGVLARPAAPRAEGLFDYRDHLEKQGIYYTLKTASTNDWRTGAKASSRPSWSDQFIAWASRTLTRGLDATDESTQLLLAMTLGQKTALTDEVSEPFMRSGTMHIFAISGLHIALMAGILLGLLRVAQLPRVWRGLIVLPLLWFYTAATGWQPSAVRSTIMMTVVIGGWILNRPGNLLNSLAAAAFIILLWDPRQLFQASFQLSFFVVLSLALVTPPLNQIRDRLLQPDPLLPPSLVPRWRRGADAPLRWFTACLTTSFAAWVGSLPLTAFYFHLFSSVTLLANVIIVPLAGLALMAELGSLLCGVALPFAAELFNNAAWFFMHSIVGASEAATKIPGAFFYVPAPSWISVGIYYALLMVAAGGVLKTAGRKMLAAAVLVLVAAVYGWRWESSRGETEITVLPLNGGHAVWVDAAGRNNDWLVDCGDEDSVNFTLKNFLRAHGVNHLSRLVLTEGNAKNIGGAKSLDGLFGVGELWTSPVHFRSTAYNKTVAVFERPRARRKLLQAGDAIGCWRVLWPPATNRSQRADDSALVLLGNFSGLKILLLSDLNHAGQNALLAQTNDLRADIVIAGLPDDGEPLCDALLDAIQPETIVIADSEFPATRRARSELKERLAQNHAPVLYTREAGAVTIVAGPRGWKWRTMDGRQWESSRLPRGGAAVPFVAQSRAFTGGVWWKPKRMSLPEPRIFSPPPSRSGA